MTNQELIDKAGLEIEIIESGNSLDATDSADALDTMNQMISAWSVSDMDMQIPPQDTLGDTIPIPIWATEGIVSNLAIKLAVTFNALVTNDLATKAREGRNLIARVLINNKLVGADMTHLPLGQGRYRHNILTDSFDS